MNSLILYDEIKDQIKTGDLIMWHSNNLLGAAIRKITEKERRQYEIDNDINVNHVSGIFRIPIFETGQRRFISESRKHGPQFSLLSQRLAEYDGQAWWYRLTITDDQRIEWGASALNCTAEGFPYGYWDVAKYILFGTPDIDPSDGLYCSEEWLYNFGDTGKAWSPNGLAANVPRLKDIFPKRIL